jgi:hypothetical protein
MIEFELPNYTIAECSDGPKQGSVVLKEFVVSWEYNGEGKITVSLRDNENKFIQSIEHVKSKA